MAFESVAAVYDRRFAWPLSAVIDRRYKTFVAIANGRADIASRNGNDVSTRSGLPEKMLDAPSRENSVGISTAVSFHFSPIGGNPTWDESRGTATATHFPSCSRAKATQQSANSPVTVSGR